MSRDTSKQTGEPKLHPDDLLDDRELAAAKDDRLAHAGIVDQLAVLATTVTMPSNIALYGPWGSGKSGIANLLKNKIDGHSDVRCVRFDAFKYADVPLRRNFISAVASELGCKQSKYHEDLYSGRTKTEIKVPTTTIMKLLGVFALLLLGLTAILAVVVSAVAFGQSRIGAHSDFGIEFKALSKQVVLAGLVPATLLAALITLASKTFGVDRSLAKPDSDEQFEKIFKDLVSAAGAKRLVVFVDELDRCSASEVVTTLDTIRTFLGIDRCVFIVAADQNVLEGALTRAAKQDTPADDTNPYYSTGSAYLDKVFQYQLSLPPLLTQSVSKYATTLVENRKGLWAEVNREYVLSVLIPTHITSPRRVKHLLNTFALTYRLAQERHNSDLLAEDPRTNAAALARLVCLRVEFPLFARHLEVDANLPALVLQLVRDKDAKLPAGTSDRAKEIARSYALESAAPSIVLVEDEPDGDDEADHRATQIGKAHNKQLLNYLSRTRQVRGPSRDMIYMQSTGTVFGLDGELALAVERAAEDADIETLQRHLDGLDEVAREGVLLVLTNQIRTGAGLAGPNAARSFLLLTEENPALPVAKVADTVAEAICVLDDDTTDFLDEDTAASAWALTKVGSEATAPALRRRVIAAITRPGFTAPDFFFRDAAL
ncbi:MAG: P-loop NTPase fold protein, partial [Rhodococcus sp. (in: high G+C Gram-positive bacteria)]